MTELLSIHNLKTYFFLRNGILKAVDEVSFNIKSGQSVGLVGESGSGKTVTALSIMRVVPHPGKIVQGEILFDGENLLEKSQKEMRLIRGKRIAMTFQTPMTYLNPVKRIGDQIAEAIIIHQGLSKSEALEKAISIMESVQIPSPEARAMDYPHQFSGGMRQRALLGIAISCSPDLLIADEPTTAIDVITAGKIMDLLKDLQKNLGLSLLFITHDLATVAEGCEKVVIMYAGNIEEIGSVYDIFKNPRHPYTEALLKSIPRLDMGRKKRLSSIKGDLPNLINPPPGCIFYPRCPYATEECKKEKPGMREVGKGHFIACIHN